MAEWCKLANIDEVLCCRKYIRLKAVEMVLQKQGVIAAGLNNKHMACYPSLAQAPTFIVQTPEAAEA